MHNIINSLVDNNIIESNKVDLYEYGLFVLLFNGFLTCLIFYIGSVIIGIYNTFLFSQAFIITRSLLGGYHFKYPLTCTICSVIYASIFMITPYVLEKRTLVLILLLLVTIIIKQLVTHKIVGMVILIEVVLYLLTHNIFILTALIAALFLRVFNMKNNH